MCPMSSARILGLFAVIPAAILLTVYFFVLIAVSKVEDKNIKAFGKLVSGFLFAAIVLIISMGCYVLITGTHPVLSMIKGWKMRMCGQLIQEHVTQYHTVVK